MAKLKITVSYNSNGGTGAPSWQVTSETTLTFPKTVSIMLSSARPSRSGYTFLGWSTSSSASSASYQPSSLFSYTFYEESDYQKDVTMYAVWRANTYTVSYNKGANGSGTNTSDTKTHNVSLTLKGAIFTRSGYNQAGWSTSDGGAKIYELGGSYTANANVTLYPVWTPKASTFTTPSSLIMNGTDEGTIRISRYNDSFKHIVTISLGNETLTYSNVDTSQSFTLPLSWCAQIPNSTNAQATVTVKTFSGSTLIGSASNTFTVYVPGWVAPTVTINATNNSSNPTVQGWNVLVQGFSTITLYAEATGAQGASIESFAFTGDGLSQSGSETYATSDILKSAGSKTWTVIVTDSRGRTGIATLTRTVYMYWKPSISSFSAVRALVNGTEDVVGTYISAKAVFSIAPCGGNNSASVSKIAYKRQAESSYTNAKTNAVSGTVYTFGGGNIAITSWYDVRFDIEDALGNSASYVAQIPTATGVSFGLNGSCARFGGPVLHSDRFECDWIAQFDDNVIAPKFAQRGTVSVSSVAAGASKNVDITFDTAFNAAPTVVACLYSSQTEGIGDCSVSVWNLTATGFSLRLENNYSSNRDIGATWVAVNY